MKLSLFIAIRYLFSKKSVNAINIISAISVIGVLFSSAALVIVLSFYNGMEKFILSQYSVFSPDLRIEPALGKTFSANDPALARASQDSGIKSMTNVLEDKVLLEYDRKQFVGQIKGIEASGAENLNKEELMLIGNFSFRKDNIPTAVLGAQMQSNLQVDLGDSSKRLSVYIPKKDINPKTTTLNPLDEINHRNVNVTGVMRFQPGFDDLIITDLDFARAMLSEPENISAVELSLKNEQHVARVQRRIQKSIGDKFLVKNREQQNPTLYKTVTSEKWIVFFIVTLIGIIAIFNIIGSLTMLVLDKRKDISVLQSLGARKPLIQQIFFFEGILISLLGGALGIGIGLGFCILQQNYGLIRTDGQTLFDAYPVDIRYSDFILIFLTVMLASTIVALMASKLSTKEIKVTDLRGIEN